MASYKVTMQLTYKWLLGSTEPGTAELNSFRRNLSRRLSSVFQAEVSVSGVTARCEGGTIMGAFPTPITPKTCIVEFTVSSNKALNKDSLKTEIKGFTQENIKILGLIPGAFLVEIEVFIEESLLPHIDLPLDISGVSELAIWFGAGFLGAWFIAKMLTFSIRKYAKRR